jgi:hypothetical protein
MFSTNRSRQALFSLFLILSVLLASFPGTAGARLRPITQGKAPMFVFLAGSHALLNAASTFRVQVALRQPSDLARLQELGVTLLEQWETGATVLASEAQLEALARLRFEPQHTDRLATLLSGATLNAQESVAESAILGLTSLDDAADGLTNTQEQWWCTDPLNADSDGDGVGDGDEVQALREWMANERSGPPASSKPFAGWPPQTDSAGYPDRHFACQDDDHDSVPDLAERWEPGLNMN